MESHPGARLLTTAGYPMDPQATGQMRPPYTDLCRPPGTDASTLSAYHSRYLPSVPLTTGSSFPFLGGMFTGSLPGAPTTAPFRTPSTTPGVNNMRQFWPPTPPPDGGYGRLALNANLFPLFGASPETTGAFLTHQGIVSRLGSTTHLSPLIDHKEHSFFSHGIGLGTPMTPTGHVTSPSSFPHLIPSLERHPVYGGHMTLAAKEIEELQHDPDPDSRLMKTHHFECLNIPSSRPKSAGKHDGKNCCDKTVDDCCKLSQSPDIKSHDDVSAKKQHKVQPCKIEVSHSPTIKPDLLSPPIDSPKSADIPSPNRNFKKTTSHSPFGTEPVPKSYEEKSQTRCSQCCANIKDVGVATKLGASESKDGGATIAVSQATSNCSVPVVSSSSTPPVSASVVSNNASTNETTVNVVEGKANYENESSGTSPVIAVKSDKQLFCKSTNNNNDNDDDENNDNDINTNTEPCKVTSSLNMAAKHVTAAVIPTAPKQSIHRDVHTDGSTSRGVVNDSLKCVVTSASDSSAYVVKEQKSFCMDHCVKVELDASNEKASPHSNNLLNSTNGTFTNRPLNKNLATSCKVKDMIKNACGAKQAQQHNSLLKNTENFEGTKTLAESSSSKTVSTSAVSLAVSPTVMSKSPSKCNMVKTQYTMADNVRKCSPFKEDVPVMKNESTHNRLDCEFSQKNNNNSTTKWTKATVSPFQWQGNNNSQDEQAMNLTVTKKTVKPEPNDSVVTSESSDVLQDNLMKVSETSPVTSNVIGVCHPNPMNKLVKSAPAVSSVNNFSSSISVLNQPASEQSTEVHILHRSSKSSFPVVSRNGTSPLPLKSTISHVNTSIHRSLKTERLMSKRGKISEIEKLSGHTGRTTLATLAPKLSKNVNFGKDISQSSHTISASSSVSSTSIVFPATVNPCIPVGIAIAQQRQDSSTSASIGKSQSSVPSSTPSSLTTASHLSTNHVTADIQTQEIIRDQKSQDLPISNNATPVDTSLLVAQGPTIVSRQWESEALTRTAALPSSWVTHGSIVAPAVWLGQGAYAAAPAPAPTSVPNVAAMNSIESSPISLPPGGYQLARDSITGHLLLIPTANIELMDRGPSVWPTAFSSAGNQLQPIQQLVTQQQQHTQFEQVLPQPETLKTAEPVDTSCNITTCDIASGGAATLKPEEPKMEEHHLSGQVPSVPLATAGQAYAFTTTFPTQIPDPAGFSYVLQSSTVMHLAHTQTTAAIQTESGRRSQATSPLHCATPSPPPPNNTCSVQVSEEEESEEGESDMECCDNNQQQVVSHTQSVTTAIQVDMDSQTNSEEDEEEEGKSLTVVKSEEVLMPPQMSDSANQTESVLSGSPKSEPETEEVEITPSDTLKFIKEETCLLSPAKTDSVPTISLKEDPVPAEEIVTSETELAPSLPVESKPVMDFIDHHGLNLLVDSIEEFASREQQTQNQEDINKEPYLGKEKQPEPKSEEPVPKLSETQKTVQIVTATAKPFTSDFKTLDTTVADGLTQTVTASTKPFASNFKTLDTTVTHDLAQTVTVPPKPFISDFQTSDASVTNGLTQTVTATTKPFASNFQTLDTTVTVGLTQTVTATTKPFTSTFKTLDTTVTDGLGLLCALAEQRFFEEALNDDSKADEPKTETKRLEESSSTKEYSNQSSSLSSVCSSPREVSEMEMRMQIEELQKKYKQKQRELELLRRSKGKEMMEEESHCNSYSSPPSEVNPSQESMKSISSSESSNDSNSSPQSSHKKSVEESDSNIPKQQNVSSVKPVQDASTKLSHSNASDSSGVCSEISSQSSEAAKIDNTSFSGSQTPFGKSNDKSNTPFFDSAWFVRRSERIFLSDAKPVAAATPVTSSAHASQENKSSGKKASGSTSSAKGPVDKEKKEHTVKLKSQKSLEETPVKKSRSKTLKPKTLLSKKRLLSSSSSSDSYSSSSEESEEEEGGSCSDAASCTSENLPLSTLLSTEHSSTNGKLLERQKRLSTDSESGQSDDLPLSVLLSERKIPELPPCILKPEDLQDNARLLVLDEGLFYAGHITKSENPDMYGIVIDGDRAARPHMFSKEEILNAAVLEVKPCNKLQLPEGSRICAFWSQQYRCLYPGTVTKASSPLTDPSLLYVEFDDGDRGRIPLTDIRMLPPDFPIVSLEPNPFMILGKRRSRTQSQNNGNSDTKTHDTPSNASKNEKTEHKKQKSAEKTSKKNPVEGSKVHKEKLKSKSPSVVNRSRSSSKSSVTGSHNSGDSKLHKKDSSGEKKKSETKSKEKKSKDVKASKDDDSLKSTKPKKHKKHKEDHHKHHHHHHKHHHHKKHKNAENNTTSSSGDTVINSIASAKASEPESTFVLENSKSDLTMKIKKSPSPHTNNHDDLFNPKKKLSVNSSSEEEEDDDEPPAKKQKKSKLVSSPSKRKERVPSCEKSKIAGKNAFLPDRQLWRWSGKSFRRPGAKGKAKKEFYRSIQRGKETIRVGDCAVFLSTGRPHLPYIGRIETMWESWGGKMDVKVKWFYHPEETKSGKKLSQLKGALFQSPHFDENDVQTISHKCEVLSWSEFQQRSSSEDSNDDSNDTYFLAGTYDPIMGTLILEPGVPNVCSSNLSEP